MGGDFGPHVTLPASIAALKRHPFLTIRLVGLETELHALLQRQRIPASVLSRLSIVPAGSAVGMDEKPSYAIRHRQDSSMCIALKQVASGAAHACISAGNTGALMAFGRMVLKMQPGIDRPAIITAVPTSQGHSYVLDLGANVDSSAQHLLQFAIMGSVLAETVDGLSAPAVGLLNVGEEVIKGNEQVRLAHELFSQHPGINYIGYIEGDDIFTGKADVVVCDGFVGNITLKGSEGLARLISRKVRRSFSRSWYRRFVALLARPVLREIQQQMDPSRRNGATLLGLQGVVVKSHGAADRRCFGYALDQAVLEVQQNVPSKIHAHLHRFMPPPAK